MVISFACTEIFSGRYQKSPSDVFTSWEGKGKSVVLRFLNLHVAIAVATPLRLIAIVIVIVVLMLEFESTQYSSISTSIIPLMVPAGLRGHLGYPWQIQGHTPLETSG